MARLWRDPSAFRAESAAPAAPRPTRRQAVALIAVLTLVAGAVAVASYLVHPSRARAFDLFSGSLFLADSVAPVSVDLATGSPSLRLIDATAQVGATPRQSLDLSVVPLYDGGGTLLLDRATGEFNMVDATGFVIKRDGGVPLPSQQPHGWAAGMSARDPQVPDLAYIEQSGAERTSVYLVSQATVHEAVTARHVQPRGSATLPVPAAAAAGARASANGTFWLLAGTGATRHVVQLSLPRRSEADGAVLRQVRRDTVTGPAALGTATFAADPDSAAAVGVATADRIDVFSPRGAEHRVSFPAPPGVDRILPVTDQRGRLSFLLHGLSGWDLVSVSPTGGDLRGPQPVTGIGAATDLVTPAQSGEDLYTMDRNSGQLIRISPDATASQLPGVGTYPLPTTRTVSHVEVRRFSDSYVIARGSRVFYDSPSHRDALALFTDGSRAPYVIAKSAAVGLNAAGDAAALSRAHKILTKIKQTVRQPLHGGSQQPPPKTAVIPAAVNTAIDCQNTTQQPNIPQIYGMQAASRSVTFSWDYPRTSNQDCIPRNYLVTAALQSADAPPAPGSVMVHDQQSTTLVGLYPNSTYSITVTAYLGTLGTVSKAVQVTTAPQGPDAPTGLTVHADSSGNWVLNWSSCGAVAADCVPSGSWEIQPQVCDGNGLLTSLPTVTAPADPTTRRQPTAVYPGSDALLGRGLSFRVMGRGIDNLPGTVSAATPCTYSWAPPVPSALTLDASAPSFTSFGTTTTATVSLNLGDDPIRDVGGVGAQVTLALTGDGTTQTKGPFPVDGSVAAISATFPGVAAGAQYTATATVQPAHGGAPVVQTQSGITTRSAWPSIQIDPTCNPFLLGCDLRVDIAGVSSANSNGELFSFNQRASFLRCGNAVYTFRQQDFDPGVNPVVTAPLSQLAGYYGDCSASVQLVESSTPNGPPVYGGTLSPTVTADVSFGPPDQADLQKGDFAVEWAPDGGPYARVTYTGSQNLSDLTAQDAWTETLSSPIGTPCGSTTGQPGTTPGSAAQVPISQSCVNLYGALPAPWTVDITYQNRVGDTSNQTVTEDLPGPPPGYTPCSVSGFDATWGATLADGITVSTDASSQLDGCSNWTYELLDTSTTPATQVCAVSTDAHHNDQPNFVLDLSACGTPPADTWAIQVEYDKPDGTHVVIGPDPLGPPPPS